MATGIFGKLPAAGDFVARGLPPGVRGALDRWVTQALTPHAANLRAWPEAGLRGVVDSPVGPLALVAVPSEDGAGRVFPLLAVAVAEACDRASVDAWADAVLPWLDRAVEGDLTTDALAAGVAAQGPGAGDGGLAVPTLWHAGRDPAAPNEVTATRFGA
ncbi:type VI secretion system-associated protein TagF [Litorisediminicola beolgyonensis]|uniref:Type VI secretion system-associated protein TagF n=1 Tax=Litorisediminicola beolgyonensis TaxID=1173614 RepID=A0ABW3ZKV9_9RHOB